MVLHQGFDAERVWRDINRLPVTHVSLVPAMLAMLLDEARGAPPKRLRILLVGGAAPSEKLVRRALDAGWPLCVSYGMSETASQVATWCLGERGELGPVAGHTATLLPEIDCQVVDETGAPTQDVGKVRLRGRCLMLGYANPEKRLGDGLDAEGWFTTGDLGKLDENDCIRIIGRSDEILISGGENIHPLEVEMLLLDCPGVDTVCVIGVDDPVWGQEVCAVYVGPFGQLEVERWCRAEIPSPLRPRRFVRLRRLPQLSSGKIDRFRLKQAYGR
jgi:O-succinylbenzoic acid--CoA ligase